MGEHPTTDLQDAIFTVLLHPDSCDLFAFTWEHPNTGTATQLV